MPLKPGQTKKIAVELKKLNGLKKLETKINKLTLTIDALTSAKGYYSGISDEINILEKKVQKEIAVTNQKIQTLKSTAITATSSLNKLIKNIARECSQVLPYYRKAKKVLFRGTSGPEAFIGRSIENRRPKDSDRNLQKYYDMILRSQGFKALRSNSIFTTSSIKYARSYGDLYIIFPKNGFAFHWNKHIRDLVLDTDELIFNTDYIDDLINDVMLWYKDKTGNNLNWNFYDSYQVSEDPERFIEELKRIKYPKANKVTLEKLFNLNFIKTDIGPTKDNFLAGLKSGNEMMISGEYYAISINSAIANYILKALEIEIDDI